MPRPVFSFEDPDLEEGGGGQSRFCFRLLGGLELDHCPLDPPVGAT